MYPRIRNISFDCHDTYALAGFRASMVADRRHPDGTGWAVLADPEGNEFCVVRSAGERVDTTTVEDQL